MDLHEGAARGREGESDGEEGAQARGRYGWVAWPCASRARAPRRRWCSHPGARCSRPSGRRSHRSWALRSWTGACCASVRLSTRSLTLPSFSRSSSRSTQSSSSRPSAPTSASSTGCARLRPRRRRRRWRRTRRMRAGWMWRRLTSVFRSSRRAAATLRARPRSSDSRCFRACPSFQSRSSQSASG